MVCERMSEIGVWRGKSVAGLAIRGLVCCGKKFRVGEAGRRCHKKRRRHFTAPCLKRMAVIKPAGLGLWNNSIPARAYFHWQSASDICGESDRWLSLIKVAGGFDAEIIRSFARICKISRNKTCDD